MLRKLKEAENAISANRKEIIDALLRLSRADLLFFWGAERELIKKQEIIWKPIINWLETLFKSKIAQTSTLDVPEQPVDLSKGFSNFINSLSDKKLAIFYVATMNLRSVLLSVAFIQKKITPEQAFEASFIEELWQNESWGVMEEASSRQSKIKDELLELEKYLADVE